MRTLKNDRTFFTKLLQQTSSIKLKKYDIEDFSEDMEVDQLTRLVAHICNAPIATLTFLDGDHFNLVGKYGLDSSISSLDFKISFCQYTILQDDILEVYDAREDIRFMDFPYVTDNPNICSYAGAPLISPDGIKLGALCVMNTIPVTLSEEQRNALRFLAEVVINNLELKSKKFDLEKEKKRLELSEERYRNLFELSEGLIGEHDMSGRIISANMAVAKSLETNIPNLIGRNLRDALEPSTRDQFDFYLEKIAQDGFAEGVMHVKTATGKSRYWAYKNIKVDDNGYPYVLCSSQDVTNMVNLEKQLRKAEKLTKQSIEAKQQFLAKVTHEIRTPMNAIVGFGKLLAKSSLKEKQKKFVNAINTSGEHLLLIVNDLLDTAKIEAGKMRFEEILFSLKDVVSSVVTILHYKAAEKDLLLSVKIDDDVPDFLIGDPTRLNQVLVNLAGNAVKFTEKGSVEIIIKTIEKDEKHINLRMEVRDTGIGIPEDKLDGIFDSFTQANNDTSRKYGGTGLGLSISKQIIELLNGKISVESELGKGTVFSFNLRYEVADNSCELPSPISEEPVYDHQLNNIRVLLAEDNNLNHLLMESIMAEWGVNLTIAINGKEALKHLQEKSYDLILMDVHMPEMDGYEATRHIRASASESFSSIPIIAMTANASEEDRRKCIDAGMNDFITKPFMPKDLFTKISHYVELKSDSKPATKKKLNTPKNSTRRKVIRLGYLRSVGTGNKKFLREVTDIFIAQIPEGLVSLDLALEKRNWILLADTAHRMKLGVNVMGMKESEKNLLLIEEEAREKITPDIKAITIAIQKLREKCTVAVEEVKALKIEWGL